jgi:hypothetical protein
VTDQINSLADLRPGDLMFANQAPGGAKLLVAAGEALLHESFVIGELNVGHVGVVTAAVGAGLEYFSGPSPARLVQAMPRGAEEIELTPAKHWNAGHAYVRLPEDYPGQAADAAAIARLFVSERVPYSFASYAALAAWRYGLTVPRLEHWIDRRQEWDADRLPSGRLMGVDDDDTEIEHPHGLPQEAICSVLADQAWSLAGKRVMQGVAHQAVTPSAMAGQLWRREGVIWGGAGL